MVGAFDSAWRSVMEILTLSYEDKLDKFYELWGRNEEWEGGKGPTPGPKGKGRSENSLPVDPGAGTHTTARRSGLYLDYLYNRKEELLQRST